MPTIVDLHIHSKYSRATSQDLDLEHLDDAARRKGIDVLATADFTHPAWFKELKNKLVFQDNGFYILEGGHRDARLHNHGKTPTMFVPSTEIACIYKQGDSCRRIHLVVVCPTLETVEKINEVLEKKGLNLKSDGRPIFGISAEEVTEIYLNADPKCLIVPAHIWTPWFSLYGAKSGFDSMRECFGDQAKNIYAIETGLSSDPPMNWQISELNNRMILSNSDAHSCEKLGREANVFDFKPDEITYDKFYNSIKNNKNLLYTIEFYPEEGKYHAGGHRKCGTIATPDVWKKNKGICPKCNKPFTDGVMNRVAQLADQTVKSQEKKRVPFKSIVPLKELIGDALDIGPGSKGVQAIYDKFIEIGGSEFNVLLWEDLPKLEGSFDPLIIEGLRRMRAGDVRVFPGYDGVYGTVKIFTKKEKEKIKGKQGKLF